MADIVYPGQSVGASLNSAALPSNTDLVIYKGDYLELFVTIKDSQGNPFDLTNSTPAASMKADYSDRSSIPFSCTTTGVPGQVRIFLSSAVTKELLPASYIWDFQLTSGTGESRTYLAGDVTVYDEVTT
jgi:hypothetical protein